MKKTCFKICQFFVVGLLVTVTFQKVSAQARIMLNGAIVNVTQGAYLVVDNSASNAITRSSGHIISEGEANIVKWNLGTTTGTYTVPWGSGASAYYPMTFTKSAGTGSGNFLFSTYPTVAANTTFLPTGVSNFTSAAGADKSLYAVDRFWQINAQSYTVKPSLTALAFTYLDAEYASPNITTKESALSAQRWNSSTSTWLDFGPLATVNTTNNTVTVATVNTADLYSWWSLNYIEDRHWVAAATSNWNNTTNWSAVAGGTGGSAVPTSTDAVFFDDVRDASSNLDVSPAITSIMVQNGYSGTITQGAHTITISDAATFSGGTFAGGSAGITITGLFTLSGGAFTSTSGTLDLKNNAAFTSGTFTHNSGTVLFSGANAQTISGTKIFNNLTISKSSNDVTLNGTGATTVNGTLTLTTRNIITSATHLLALGSSASATGSSASSFVSGPMTKVINAAGSFTFPLGNSVSGYYRPVTIASTSGGDTWTTQYFSVNPTTAGYPSLTYNNAVLGKISRFEYWNISRAGSTSANVTLSYNTGSYVPPNVGNEANLRVAHWNGTMWDLPTGSGTPSQSGSNTAGTITMTNVTTFSPYTLGSLDADSSLPVRWISFTGSPVSGGVMLSWTTGQERNNDYFDIERSLDGIDFVKIGTIRGAGNSDMPTHYTFVDTTTENQKYYFRLRQVDYDTQSDYSNVITIVTNASVISEAVQQWMVTPNPSASSQQITVMSVGEISEVSQVVDITLVSGNGVVLLKEKGSLEVVLKTINNKLLELASGIYVLQFKQGAHMQSLRISRY